MLPPHLHHSIPSWMSHSEGRRHVEILSRYTDQLPGAWKECVPRRVEGVGVKKLLTFLKPLRQGAQ